MNKNYDVAIIGSGIAGIMAGYELIHKRPELKIAIIEQGTSLDKRVCPIIAGKSTKCVNCTSCATMNGFGGAGAFSDGKYNLTTAFGGWLTEYISDEETLELIKYVDEINIENGATTEYFTTRSPQGLALEKAALPYDLHLAHANCKHLGTENNLKILANIYDRIKDKIDVVFNTKVTTILPIDTNFKLTTQNGDIIDTKYLVVAPGRAGAEWFSDQLKELDVPMTNNQVDIGVRVELPYLTFKDVTDAVYEAKFIYRTECHGDRVRTFCMNPKGHVVSENVDGLITVNGHSYADPKLQSENTNFSLLVSSRFTEPFKDPYAYGKRIASLSNLLGEGVIVQRYGDLKRGRRTDAHRLAQSFVRPTLKAAVPGDLALVIPKRQLDDIIEMIERLDKICPGTANYDTLLYGVEVKFYSAKPELTSELETIIPNMFAIGDGAGVTRGLAQAAASGIHVARAIMKRI
ncbi:MAG: NAD(P)/FAD-dependent oxidoreductase [Clostridia bacterium]|nr:NAD(P)/FAD-dependent oxidoreductase [Clostridia bacterium]